MTVYLNEVQVLFLHHRLTEETGGTSGVRDLALLESAVARPRATFDEHDLYPDLFSKAAALMESIVLNHPFVDGNKRCGIAAAGLFLLLNGVSLTATNDQLEAFTWSVAEGALDHAAIAMWFASHSEAGPPRR